MEGDWEKGAGERVSGGTQRHNSQQSDGRVYLGLVWHYSFSLEAAAAFDSPIMQKERERRGRLLSLSSHQSKSGRKCGCTQTIVGALGHQSDSALPVSYSRGRKGKGVGGVAKHAMTNDSWNGKEREGERRIRMGSFSLPFRCSSTHSLPREGLEKSALSQSKL